MEQIENMVKKLLSLLADARTLADMALDEKKIAKDIQLEYKTRLKAIEEREGLVKQKEFMICSVEELERQKADLENNRKIFKDHQIAVEQKFSSWQTDLEGKAKKNDADIKELKEREKALIVEKQEYRARIAREMGNQEG